MEKITLKVSACGCRTYVTQYQGHVANEKQVAELESCFRALMHKNFKSKKT